MPADSMFAPNPGQLPLPSEIRQHYTYNADLIKDLSRTVISSKIERDAANTANYNSKQILT